MSTGQWNTCSAVSLGR